MTGRLHKIHKQNAVICALICAAIAAFLISVLGGYSFLYGLNIAFGNLVMLHVFYVIQARHLSRYLGQALVLVINSLVVRWLFMGVLLVVGFTKLEFNPERIMFGFVFGQIVSLFNQLLGVSTRYVK